MKNAKHKKIAIFGACAVPIFGTCIVLFSPDPQRIFNSEFSKVLESSFAQQFEALSYPVVPSWARRPQFCLIAGSGPIETAMAFLRFLDQRFRVVGKIEVSDNLAQCPSETDIYVVSYTTKHSELLQFADYFNGRLELTEEIPDAGFVHFIESEREAYQFLAVVGLRNFGEGNKTIEKPLVYQELYQSITIGNDFLVEQAYSSLVDEPLSMQPGSVEEDILDPPFFLEVSPIGLCEFDAAFLALLAIIWEESIDLYWMRDFVKIFKSKSEEIRTTTTAIKSDVSAKEFLDWNCWSDGE
ncbi:hypothetical protein [Ruegeria atlantica]|uniref:hypothetical protein n=1 Tax=Ruegeria atlantica TaxID=81569 RepID=UPI001480A31C|nr:hypothetical protein [Ruegeria atlantica]